MNDPSLRLESSVVDEAIADSGKAIEVKPHDVRTYITRGYLHLFHGNYDQAAMDYDIATNLHPVDEHLKQRLSRLGCVLGVAG